MPMSLSRELMEFATPSKNPATELTVSLELGLDFALSMAPETALPSLSVTAYLSFILAPKLRTSRPPDATPFSAAEMSSFSLRERYAVAAKAAPPTHTPPRSSPARPPRTLAVVILFSSVTLTSATELPSGAGAGAAASARAAMRLRPPRGGAAAGPAAKAQEGADSTAQPRTVTASTQPRREDRVRRARAPRHRGGRED
mmetsp:Transcript_49038/g.152139  ORF Transcript_49038/g.152139 Transcript_49038/m.152139 type:complete len:200 (+) Transcript_49038:326-925(+)